MRCSIKLYLATGLAVCATPYAAADVVPGNDRIMLAELVQVSSLPVSYAMLRDGAAMEQQVIAAQRARQVVGAKLQYTVQANVLLSKVGARFGVSTEVLARDNGLRKNALLKPGQNLWIDNRHIVPEVDGDGLYINAPQRMLYHFQNGELLAAYPVGIGKPTWPTPIGKFTLIDKSKDKTWFVPASIQEEMRAGGLAVKTSVPPGPGNPLGRYWLGLDIPSIGIHGTNDPKSIYRFQSHGCIRLHPDDIEALSGQVERGVAGQILYAPVMLAESGGRVYLEVHPDIYRRGGTGFEALKQKAYDIKVAGRVDWPLAADVLAKADGVARDVTRVETEF